MGNKDDHEVASRRQGVKSSPSDLVLEVLLRALLLLVKLCFQLLHLSLQLRVALDPHLAMLPCALRQNGPIRAAKSCRSQHVLVLRVEKSDCHALLLEGNPPIRNGRVARQATFATRKGFIDELFNRLMLT